MSNGKGSKSYCYCGYKIRGSNHVNGEHHKKGKKKQQQQAKRKSSRLSQLKNPRDLIGTGELQDPS